ncbi:MAG: DNA (cytosine-5-)-methyltransferase [Nitrosopumilaceae archaeon]|nr:DNA cytosine methyltransferase [Nitrosopumilaceae archaeon]NIU01875.1 DNA cytosine methyltransferase [Nitrosopumilaceae archaeon]NIU88279.1 DNA (cytosine-5-)-methyltransferase [Nitrosopumilaceae archaeon]NIV66571.1 DNA (cytosine-5-)-methyltransferase [Nitrosopumilaceae archaeon]NIX62476.1 DNA (cytosine-5-)-methyltransferase [Nitrosopumilaceae archaeon]
MVDYLPVVDLFSGPGGLSRGFEDARNHNFRFKVTVANDSDKNAALTYQENHQNAEFVLGSIAERGTKRKVRNFVKEKTGRETVDLVIGGPPCKGFSLANKMSRNMENPMNHLITHFFDMVKKLDPTAFVMENVPGIMAMEGGKVVESLISDFKRLGYRNADSWLLNAADYGVPQLRRRAFLIGSKSDIPIEKPKPTHAPKDLAGVSNLKPYVTVKEAIDDLPEIRPGREGYASCSYSSKVPNGFQQMMRKKSSRVQDHVVTKNTPLVIKRIRSVPPGGNWEDIPRELMQVGGKYGGIELAHSMIYKRLLKNEPSITITNFRKGMIIHPVQHRLLSVREAARIQTFPDDYKFEGGLSSRQQQVSDAVPVLLGRRVAETMLIHLHKVIRLATVN